MPDLTSEKPRRRWFRPRYSLATLFVVVTVFGVWLGWQVQIVHERQAILNELRRPSESEGHLSYICIERNEAEILANGGTTDRTAYAYARVSLIRWLLGDESCLMMAIPFDCDPKLIERAEYAFPEAMLQIDGGGSWGVIASRGCLCLPADERLPNKGSIFKTGRKPSQQP